MSLIFDLKRKLHNMYWPNVGRSKRSVKDEFRNSGMFNEISKNSVNTISSKAAAICKVLGINTCEFNLESKRHVKNMRGRTLTDYCKKICLKN